MAEWRFLLDENVDPKVATYLEKEGVFAEHVRDTLGQGADDEADVLPHACEHDLIVLTSDLKDFGDLPNEAHAGVIVLHDDSMPAYRVASALLKMIDAYPDRDSFAGREELDAWAWTLRERLTRSYETIRDRIAAVVRTGIDDGELVSAEPRSTATFIIVAVDEAGDTDLTVNTDGTVEIMLSAIEELVFEWLRTA